MKHLILVDGNSLMFRAYHATASKSKTLLQNKQGVYTNALLSFIKMFEIILQESQGHVLVAFDSPCPTKRHQLYDDYKKGRPETPTQLISQIPLIKKYLSLRGIKHHAQDEYEADDIIGTLAKEAGKNNVHSTIYSSDQDLLQLVDDQITVCLIKKGLSNVKCYTPSSLLQEYGLKEYQMIDYKSLMGDASDNIQGVPGIGPKTAQILINKYDNLDNLINSLDEIKPSWKNKISNSLKELELSKILITISLAVPLPFDYLQTKSQPCCIKELKLFYEEMDFRRLSLPNDNLETLNYTIIKNNEALNDIVRGIQKQQTWSFYFDISSTEENECSKKIQGIGLSDGKQHFFLDANMALKNISFVNYLEDNHFVKNIFNYYEIQVLLKRQQQIQINCVAFDLLLASYLLMPLKSLEFNYVIANININNATKYLNNSTLEYSIAIKAFLLHQSKDLVMKRLKDEKQLFVFYEVELLLSKFLSQLENDSNSKFSMPLINYQKYLLSNSHELGNYFNFYNNHIYDLLFNFPFPSFLLKMLATLGNIQKIKKFFLSSNPQTSINLKLKYFGILFEQENTNNNDVEEGNNFHNFITNEISKELNISLSLARQVEKKLFNDPEILIYSQKLLQQFKTKKYLLTFLKRKIYFEGTSTIAPNNLHILSCFLLENIFDMKKLALSQLFYFLLKNHSHSKITYNFAIDVFNQKINDIIQHCNYFLDIKIL